jgi:multiple sugar transport system substrate-binding protein
MSRPTPRPALARRGVRLAATAAAAALVLTACAQGGGTTADEEPAAVPTETGPVTIRFSWWGSDTRHQLTQQVLDAFEEKYPNITVQGDFTDWGGYWDKLATSVAAKDAPDVITQEERYLRDYATRGVLLNLDTVTDTLKTEDLDPSVVDSAVVGGARYGVPTGVNVYSIVADPAAFAAAGVEMPDDTTWTWDDYAEIAAEITAKTGGTVYGAQDYAFNEPGFSIYARQQGQSLYEEDGSLGYDDELLAEWWQGALDMMKAGAEPDAAKSVEIDGAGPEGSLLGTNAGAMSQFWSNQLGAISTASGRELTLLRFPGESEHERTGMYFKPAMYYSIAAGSEHPQAAAQLIDFLVNSEEAGALLLSDRGLPANLTVREAVTPKFSATDQQAAEFLTDLQDEVVDPVAVPPVGSGEVVNIIKRLTAEVLFERLTPEQAAAQFTAEVTAETAAG